MIESLNHSYTSFHQKFFQNNKKINILDIYQKFSIKALQHLRSLSKILTKVQFVIMLELFDRHKSSLHHFTKRKKNTKHKLKYSRFLLDAMCEPFPAN